jgi:hypothetical protein
MISGDCMRPPDPFGNALTKIMTFGFDSPGRSSAMPAMGAPFAPKPPKVMPRSVYSFSARWSSVMSSGNGLSSKLTMTALGGGGTSWPVATVAMAVRIARPATAGILSLM